MLTFSVTVGPNKQCLAEPGLLANVLCDGEFLLENISAHRIEACCKTPRTSSTSSLTGASKSEPGGQEVQPLYWRSKSSAVKWPITLVIVTEQLPQAPPKLKSN